MIGITHKNNRICLTRKNRIVAETDGDMPLFCQKDLRALLRDIMRDQDSRISNRMAITITGAVSAGVVAITLLGPDAPTTNPFDLSAGYATMALQAATIAADKGMHAAREAGDAFLAGAATMLGACAHVINTSITGDGPASLATLRSHLGPLSDWAASQKTNALTMTRLGADTLNDVVSYLVPDSAGEKVERAIIVIAALKSFSDGLDLARRLFRNALGVFRKGSRDIDEARLSVPSVPDAAHPPARIIIEHHHYHHGIKSDDRIEDDPEIEEAEVVAERHLDQINISSGPL